MIIVTGDARKTSVIRKVSAVGRIKISLALGALGFILSGCSVVAPPYPPSLDNVQTLKNSGAAPARVGTFTESGSGVKHPISLRANSLVSPYGSTWSAYISEAVTRELTMAGKMSPNADVVISGTLLRNEIDPAIVTASGDVSARFIVRKGDTVRYDQVKSVHREWESSFAAAVAIPKAVTEYGYTVQALLAMLYADPAFLDALK
ncbi:conserved hypothetical protein [Cupriavidus taiwanensis]|uniref:Lipoprotein n=1 Tax=Cupriavidus taiwanensis TaxID=164546 RepID=A0A375CBY6_9BURK|nr:hypothetical protein [Cupriavidus taiwanensis]SOY67321.1 conserved hypothetical protein [Cupriavidus taiwanensis]